MIEFEWQPWFAMLTVAAVFLGLQLRRGASADVLFLSGLLAVTAAGVVSVPEALAGFSNPAVLAIAGLLAVSAGLRSTGVLDWIGRMLLGSSKTEGSALRRLAVSLIVSSAFVLNTVLVAMMMPVVIDWCRRRHISPSRLLLPVSYLAILGGVCTLIGTSTTLVVNGLLESEHLARSREVATLAAERPQQPAAAAAWEEEHQLARKQAFLSHITPMRLFDISAVGIPCALAGAVALILLGARFLPNRDDLVEQFDEHRREYLVEMRVMPECRLIGQTVEQAGLRHLPGLYLIEIDRDGDIITPVSPTDVMQTNDRLIFTGVVSTIVDLEKIPGLAPAADSAYETNPGKRQQRHLTEVVLSRTSPLIGRTVKEANFRQLYGAAVVAVHRNGVRLTNKIGNIHLEPGDTLLLQTRTEFVPRYRNSRDFYLVSSVEGAQSRRHDRAPLAGLLMLGLIVWLSATSLFELPLLPALASPPIAAFIVVMIMIATRCLPTSEARSAIELPVLLTVIGALGLGRALTESGAAQGIAERLVWAAQGNPYFLLIVVYLVAALFTELITNVAVATMLFPIAVAVAWEGGYNPRPFIMAIAIASSLTFLTPVGYQSNLMVMGPGGYRPIDYLRCGLPVSIAVAATALVLLPRVWPF
ncbi:MAG: SLC13 family permease [Planctomycetales bacterium]|nr:SLC13 family permease [Planctomycetales bacterium]